jgi:hypothetical protein
MQGELEGVVATPDLAAIVAKTAAKVVELLIDIPRITVTPSDDATLAIWISIWIRGAFICSR